MSIGGGGNVTASGGTSGTPRTLTFDGGTGVNVGTSGSGGNLVSSQFNTLDVKGILNYQSGGFINPASGTVQLDGATINVPTGGVTLGTTTVNLASTVNVTNNSTMNTTGTGTILNNATLALTGGTISGSSKFTNAGAFNFQTANPTTATMGSFTQVTGGSLGVRIGATGPGNYDVLSLTGSTTSTLGGVLNVSVLGTYVPNLGDQFTVISSALSTLTGTFSAINVSGLASGFVLDPLYSASSFILQLDPAPVPIPASALLLGSGLIGLVGISRSRFRFKKMQG